VWARGDQGLLTDLVLDGAALLPAEDQRQVAKVAITAFLEASLRDVDGYRGLFRRPMTGRSWLPQDIYLVASDDGRTSELLRPWLGRDATLPGLTIETDGTDRAVTADMPLRALQPDQQRAAIAVSWSASPAGGPAIWRLTGLSGIASMEPAEPNPMDGPPPSTPTAATHLRLDLANASLITDASPIDPQVVLTTTDGVAVGLPLSTWGLLPPPLPTQLGKLAELSAMPYMRLSLPIPVERVLQTYDIPLAAFAAADASFDPAALDSVELRFDRGAGDGSVYIARVGIATP
jgi:hypothetical protein